MNFEVRLIDAPAFARLGEALASRDRAAVRRFAGTALAQARLGAPAYPWHMPGDETWVADSREHLSALQEMLESPQLRASEVWEFVEPYENLLVAHVALAPCPYGRPARFTLDGRSLSNDSNLDDATLALFREALRKGQVELPRQPAVAQGKRFMCYLGSRYRGFGLQLDRATGLLEKLEGMESRDPRFGDAMWILDEADATALLDCGKALAGEHPVIAEELEALRTSRTGAEKYCVSTWSYFEER